MHTHRRTHSIVFGINSLENQTLAQMNANRVNDPFVHCEITRTATVTSSREVDL